MNPSALIAEDEPILAQALTSLLERLWPELVLLPIAQDGAQALDRALANLPDICFLDIQMPEINGLEVAELLAEQWPQDQPLPRIVFVTAYDEHAVAAFERAAVDYLLKPVQADRLTKTCLRLQERLRWQIAHGREAHLTSIDATHFNHGLAIEDPQDEDSALLSAVRALSDPERRGNGQASHLQTPLRLIQVSVGQSLQIIPVQNVLYFEAADKYVRVVTCLSHATQPELLIRTPLRELIPRLDAQQFWQIHRSLVVNMNVVESVSRQHGRLRVHIHGRTEILEVSRMYASLFRAM